MRNKICFYIMLVCCIGLCMSVTGCKSSKEAGKYDGEVLYNGFDSTKDMYRVSQLFDWNYSPMAKLEVVGKDDFLPVVVEDEETIAKQAEEVVKLIDELPAVEKVKESDKAAVAKARAAYGDLAKSGKLAVTNIEKLKELEASSVLASLHTIGDLGEDFTNDISNSGSWLGYSGTLKDPMKGTIVFKASGIKANQDGAFYISMFHDGSKDYGQAGDGIAFWFRTHDNTIFPENSTGEPIPFKSGKRVSADKEYTFYVTYKVASDYSKLTVTIRMVEANGSVVAEGSADIKDFKLVNFGKQTVKSWLGDEDTAKNHQTFYVNPGNSSGVNIKSAWAATQESDYQDPVDPSELYSEDDLAPRQGEGALRVSYERGSFTEILARFDDSLIPDMPVEKLCEISVKIFNYSDEEKKVSLSLMKEQNMAVALDDNEFTLAPYAWTECKLSMDSVVVEYLSDDLIGLNIRFKDVIDSIYYIDDFRVSFESEYGDESLALIEKVKALTKELKGLKDKTITKDDKDLLVSLYSEYLELPMAYQYMVENVDLLQEAIKSYYAIISKENLKKGSDVILHANEILGVSQFGEYAGGTVSFTTEDKVDGDGCVSLDFDGTVDYINIPITPTTANGFKEVHLWVNNPTENKYAVYVNWKLSDAAVGEAILEDNLVGGYLIPAKSGWVEIVYRSEFAVSEINVAMLDKRNEATPATDHILIGKIVGYKKPVKIISPHVKKVEKMIASLPAYKSGYSKKNRDEVAKVREAYYALTELQQSQVSNISRLIGIEASIWREGFAGIPKSAAKITKYDRKIEKKFEALRTAYEALDPAVQKAVAKDMALLEKLEDKMGTFGKNALHFNESIEQAGVFEGGKGTYTKAEHFAKEAGSLKLTFDGSKDWITVPVTPSKVVPYDELHIWVNNTSNQKMAFYLNWNGSTEAIGKKVSGGNLESGYVLPANSGWVELVYKTHFDLSEMNIVALNKAGEPTKTKGTLHVGKAMYVYNIYDVIDMIAALDGTNKEAIWAARDAYEALIPESKEKVTNLSKLRKLEKAMIAEVEALIDALPPYSTSYTSADKKAVRAARTAYDHLRPADQKKVKNISKLIEIEKQLASYSETALHFDTRIDEVTGPFSGGTASYTTDEHYTDDDGSLKLDFDGSKTWVTVPIKPTTYKSHDAFRIWVNNDSDSKIAFQINWTVSDAASGDCVSDGKLEAGYVLPAHSGWVEIIYNKQLKEITELNITALNEGNEAINTSGTVYVGRAEYVYHTNDVIAMIDALDGTDKEAVKAARAAYNALTAESKAKITNIDKLIGFEADIWREGFAELPPSLDALTVYSESVRTKVKEMLASYEELDPAVQKVVKSDKALLEEMLAKLEQLQVALIEEVEALIEALPAYAPGYSDQNKEAVKAAREAYNNLDAANKAQVSNADKLFEIEANIWIEGFMELPANPDEMSIYSAETRLKLEILRQSYEMLDDEVKAKVAENEALLAALEAKLKTFREDALHFDKNIDDVVSVSAGGSVSYTTATHADNQQGSLKLTLNGSTAQTDINVAPVYKEHKEFRIWVNNDSNTNIAFFINANGTWETSDAANGAEISGENLESGYLIPAHSGWVEVIYKKELADLSQLIIVNDANWNAAAGTVYIGRAEYVYDTNDSGGSSDSSDENTALHFDTRIDEATSVSAGGALSYVTDVHADGQTGSLKLTMDGSTAQTDIDIAPVAKEHDGFRIWVNNDSDTNIAFFLNANATWETSDAANGAAISGGNLANGFLIPAKSGWVEVIYNKALADLSQIIIVNDANWTASAGTVYIGRAEYVYDSEDETNQNYTLTDLTQNAGYTNSLAQSSVSIGSWDFAAANLPNAMEGTIKFNATGIATGVDGAMYITLFHDGSANAGQAGDGIMTYVNSSSLYMAGSTIPFESGKTITAGQTYKFTVAYKVAEDYSKLTLSVRIELADGTLIVDSGDQEVTSFSLPDFGSQTVESWLKNHANVANHQTLYINGGNSTQLTVSAVE